MRLIGMQREQVYSYNKDNNNTETKKAGLTKKRDSNNMLQVQRQCAMVTLQC